MTALGIEISSRDEDVFYQPKPNTYGMSLEYFAVKSRIANLERMYYQLCDIYPIPEDKLSEIQDELERLEKEKEYLYKRDQMAISNMRKEQLAR